MTQQPNLRATLVAIEQYGQGNRAEISIELSGNCAPELADYLARMVTEGKPLTFALMEVGQPVPRAIPGGAFTFAPKDVESQWDHEYQYNIRDGLTGFRLARARTVFR